MQGPIIGVLHHVNKAVELCTKIMVVHGAGLHPGIIVTTMGVLTPRSRQDFRTLTAHHAQVWGMAGSSITWTNWTSINEDSRII